MKRIIYSIYIEIENDKFADEKSEANKKNFAEFEDELYANKKEYADTHGVEYVLYKRDNYYLDFYTQMKTIRPNISEYNIINFYKHYLLHELSKEYDEILYLDYDVVINTDKNYFEHNDLSMFQVYFADQKMTAEQQLARKNKIYSPRSVGCKYWCLHGMSDIFYIPVTNIVFNTAIIGASKEVLKDYNILSELNEIFDAIDELKVEGFYPKNIRDNIDYNNEAVFTLLVMKNNIPYNENFIPYWHRKYDASSTKDDYDNEINLKGFYHLINKEFSWHFPRPDLS